MVSIPNSIKSNSAVQSHMVSYIEEAIQQAEKQYKCRANSNSDWVRYGIARVLDSHEREVHPLGANSLHAAMLVGYILGGAGR